MVCQGTTDANELKLHSGTQSIEWWHSCFNCTWSLLNNNNVTLASAADIYILNANILPELEEDINIRWSQKQGRCRSLFESMESEVWRFHCWKPAVLIREEGSGSFTRGSPVWCHLTEHSVQSRWPPRVSIHYSVFLSSANSKSSPILMR